MTNHRNKISLRTAAIIAGLTILIMAIVAPFAEVYVYPKLVIPENAAQTVKNIIEHKTLFVAAMFGYVITFIGDIVVSWALYVLLKPVHEHLSLLAAWFRLVFAILALGSLLNLVNIFRLLSVPGYSTVFEPNQLYVQVMLCLNTFKYGFHFGILFFSIHLLIVGYLIFKCNYIPKVMGILVMISGLGYLLTSIKPFVFPNLNVDFALYTFFGELIFMLWLLIKGSKIREAKWEE